MFCKARMVNALTRITHHQANKQTATITKLLKKYEKAAMVCPECVFFNCLKFLSKM